MANYYLNVSPINRSKGHSLADTASYICGRKVWDSYNNRTWRYDRDDVLYQHIFLPEGAPLKYYDLQYFCNKVEEAEKRRDARTARYFKGSLPNELLKHELSRIVREYVETNFVACGLCAIAAIHEGKNEADPSRNNPHAHIIVSTRTLGPEGFSEKKDREHDQRQYILIWREQWAQVQNRAYERHGLDIRVSQKSLKAQGIQDREPTSYVSYGDYLREQRGERTAAGDRKRAVMQRNKERSQKKEMKRDLSKGFSR